MSRRDRSRGGEPAPADDAVPDAVLAELQQAFGGTGAVDPRDVDLDDPAIDRMLGIDPSPASPPLPPAEPPRAAEVEGPGAGAHEGVVMPADRPVAASPSGERDAPIDAPVPADPPRATPVVAADPEVLAAAPAPTRAPRTRRGRRKRAAAEAAAAALEEGTGTVRVVPVARPGDGPGPTPAAPSPAAPPPVDPPRRRDRPTVVLGADDELPDTVYLDDVEDRPGAAPIVLGDELDSSGAFDAVELPPRSMDPRLRARRIAVKRAEGRRRLVWVGVVVGVLLLVVAVVAVFASSLFGVDRVRVQGQVYTDPVALQEIVDDLRGEPILLVDTLATERRLEQIPWVERARVTTDFPGTVTIDLRERRPLATFQGADGRYRVIDAEGRVLDVIDNRPVDYVLVTGPAPDTPAGSLAGAPYAGAATLVGALPREIRDLTLSVSVDPATGDLGMALAAPADPAAPDAEPRTVEVNIGDASALEGKLARLLQEVRDGLDDVARIDVATNEVSITRAGG